LQIYEVEKVNFQDDSINSNKYARTTITAEQKRQLLDIGHKISSGAKSFLKEEYAICLIFIAVMLLVIGFVTEYQWWTAVAFLLGALISMVCGTIGMVIATRTNYRVTYCAKDSLSNAFHIAYRAGCAMGFALVSLGLLVLLLLVVVYKRMMDLPDSSSSSNTYQKLFEAVAGYGLGGSFVALFGRVGGGIYTKAADVGADMVGKIEAGLNEDSPYNPATIADNVGDNVGDVAGMSADLFGSFAESTCAALVISCNTLVGTGCDFHISNLFYPLLLIAFGIVVCLLVSVIAISCTNVEV
jgi:inorganic pyrophosphatase